MSAKDCVNLNISTLALFSVCQATQFICGETILLSTRDKRVAITLHKIKILNLGNQYHKDATQVAPGIIEKF